MTSDNQPRPTYSEQLEAVCNMRTAEEITHDEWTDEVKAAIQQTANDYGKTYTQVATDVDIESPKVLQRNREDLDDQVKAFNIGPYPGGTR